MAPSLCGTDGRGQSAPVQFAAPLMDALLGLALCPTLLKSQSAHPRRSRRRRHTRCPLSQAGRASGGGRGAGGGGGSQTHSSSSDEEPTHHSSSPRSEKKRKKKPPLIFTAQFNIHNFSVMYQRPFHVATHRMSVSENHELFLSGCQMLQLEARGVNPKIRK